MNREKGPELKMKSLDDSTDEHACKILITCKQPSESGKMCVEMSYEGDPTLASYLLESAQGFIDHED